MTKRFLFISLIFIINQIDFIQNQINDIQDRCSTRFDQLSSNFLDSSNSNQFRFYCPRSCFTRIYLSNSEIYPVFGNETYSGNSLICKSALHDGRINIFKSLQSTLIIRNNSFQSNFFDQTLRNGILSSRSTSRYFSVYQFLNEREKEENIPDIAIEHKNYLYSSGKSSSIECRSEVEIESIQPIEIDQRWKIWNENRLKIFTHPHNFTRNASLDFCLRNNGTLFYWNNIDEENLLQDYLSTTIYDLFRYQRRLSNNNNLTFFVGLIQINRTRFWQSNKNFYNQSSSSQFNRIINNEDFCTKIHFDGRIQLIDHRCDELNHFAYPLCRMTESFEQEENYFIYRLENDNQRSNYFDVQSYCSSLGGHPIYAKNAFEWQIIQEIMLRDRDFNQPYVYTDFFVNDSSTLNGFWRSRNLLYNQSLNYLTLARRGTSNGYSFHLSKANDESYYYLYDINPDSSLNSLRFCRKDDVRQRFKQTNQCQTKTCQVNCNNVKIDNIDDNLSFGFYLCRPKESLVGIVYTHSFPFQTDFIRSESNEKHRVSIRENSNWTRSIYFQQVDPNLSLSCVQTNNFERDFSSNGTRRLNCDFNDRSNRTFNNLFVPNSFNGLISIGFEGRTMSSQHLRFIDYDQVDSRCRQQGIYHPTVNQCICSPGFYGDQCQYSCPTGYYGKTCRFHCSTNESDFCRWSLICLPDPYGCSCYSGWYGFNCDQPCPRNRYGPDCLYQCSCSTCNRFTGLCDCDGSECYQGPINRQQLESRCSSKSDSSNLVLIIVLPIVSVTILILIVSLFIYKKINRIKSERLFSKENREDFQSNSTIF